MLFTKLPSKNKHATHETDGRNDYYRGTNTADVVEARFPELADFMWGLTSALHTAGQGSKRMSTPHPDLHVYSANRYWLGGQIENHFDEESGVALVLGTAGLVETVLQTFRWKSNGDGRFRIFAEFQSGPNELVAIPARVGSRGGDTDQKWHGMTNKTRLHSESKGWRKSLAMAYGADPAHDIWGIRPVTTSGRFRAPRV